MKKLKLIGVLLFLAGFLAGALVFALAPTNQIEIPFAYQSTEVRAPGDFISSQDIKVYDDRIVIYVDNAQLSRYADSGSMLPVLSEYSNGIKIKPLSEEDVNLGDIITFKDGDNLIVHRVIEKGIDSEGIYFITKGDNNPVNDGKIRFSQIDSKTIMLIY